MPAERYYVDHPLKADDTVILSNNEFHHLARVMRIRVDEDVELINGKGVLAQARVKEIQKDKALLRIEKVETQAPRKQKVILAQAIPKPNRLDFILEKGTELGADEFLLFPSQHSLKKDFSPQQIERLNTQVIAAMKQCGRLFIPKILFVPSLNDALKVNGIHYFGDIDKEAPLFIKQGSYNPAKEAIVFFVGPESGFTENEINQLKDNGAIGVKLHHNILRTDTASLVALTLIEQMLS